MLRIILAVVLIALMLGGCTLISAEVEAPVIEESTAAEDVNAGEESMKENADKIQLLTDLLQCPERTAQSMWAKFERELPENVCEIEMIPQSVGCLLRLVTDSGREYYAWIEPDCFVSEITADSPDGESIYRPIQ